MGEIDRHGAFVVRVYSNEPKFEEPHVHVWKGGAWVKISIPTRTKSARLLSMSKKQMSRADVIQAVRIVEENARTYMAEYKRLSKERHG